MASGGNDSCLRLRHSVGYSIEVIAKSSNTTLNEYLRDVKHTTCDILLDCVIKDLEKLHAEKKLEGSNDVINAVALSSAMARFEACVLSTGFEPPRDSYLRWRRIFYYNFSSWMVMVNMQMKKIVLDAVHHDESIDFEFDSSQPPSHLSSSSDDDEDDCVFTRVRENSYISDDVTSNEKSIPSTGHIALHHLSEQTGTSFNKTHKTKETSFNETIDFTDQTHVDYWKQCGTTSSSVARTTIKCSHSVIDVIVLVNRFAVFVSDLNNSIFSLPHLVQRDWLMCLEACRYKQEFSFIVCRIMADMFHQFCDCILNLDICCLPRSVVNSYLLSGTLNRLRQRVRQKELDCCRHQLAGQSNCKIAIKDEEMNADGGEYDKMSRRLNNIALLHNGMTSLWFHVATQLRIEPASFPTISSAKHLSGSSTSDSSSSHYSQTSVEDGMEGETKHEMSSRVSVRKKNSSQRRLPQNRHSTHGTIHKDSPGTLIDQQRNCLNLDNLFHGDVQTGSKQYMDVSWLKLRIEEIQTIAGHLLTQTKDQSTSTSWSCLTSLASCLVWRISREVVAELWRAFKKSKKKKQLHYCDIDFDDATNSKTLCRGFSDALDSRLRHIKSHLHSDVIKHACVILKDILIKEVEKMICSFWNYCEDISSPSLFLLFVIKDVIKQFRHTDQRACNATLQSMQYHLQFCLMSSRIVVGLKEQMKEDRIDNLGVGRSQLRIIEEVFSKQKSFSGQQLVQNIASKIETSIRGSDNRSEALKLCNQAFDVGLIYLVFELKSNRTSRLPELVECSEFVSSFDQQNRSSSGQSPSTCIQATTPDSDDNVASSFSSFFDDHNHIYALDLSASKIPQLDAQRLSQSKEGKNLLTNILLSRQQSDVIARNYLKNSSKYLPCSCLP